MAKAARRSRTVSELVDALRASYGDGPPTEAAVRAQAFPFYRRHWVARWPPAIALPPSLTQEDAQGSVDRDSLLRSAASVRNDTTPSTSMSGSAPGALEPRLEASLAASSHSTNGQGPRIAFGFRSPETLIALAMLSLGGHPPVLPGGHDPRISQ